MMVSTAEHIINDFSLLPSWEEKYEHLISFGETLADLAEKYKTEKYLIRGCQSKVWLVSEYKDDKLYFYGDSDALITRGLVALIIQLYSGSSPKEINANKIDVFSKIGLHEHLSMTRSNGLKMMLDTIKQYAIKYEKN